jgi:hypothetical protein
MRRSRAGLAACGILLATLLACALVPSRLVELVAVPVVAGLFAIEFDRSGGVIATRIVKIAGRLLPKPARGANTDEWTDHVLATGEAGLRPVLVAMGIAMCAAPRIALRLRAGPKLGRYIVGLLAAAYGVMSADHKRSGPEFWRLVQAFTRMPALYAAPLLAPLALRSQSRTLVRRLSYPIGIAGWWGMASVTSPTGNWWLQQLIFLTVTATTLFGWTILMLKFDAVITFAYRLAGMTEDG